MKKTATIIYKSVSLVQALFWIIGAIIILPQESANKILIIFMLINGGAFLTCFFLVSKTNLFVRAGAFLFLIVNLVLTFADQMGVYDYIILVLNAAAIISLLYISKDIMHKKDK